MDPEVIKELSTKISSHPNPPEPKGIVSIAVQLWVLVGLGGY